MTTRPGRLAGTVSLITGGASGIGRAVALRFADEGAAVSVLDLGPADSDLAAAGVDAYEGDVRDPATMERAVADIVDRHGRLDTFVANAGMHDGHRPLRSYTLEVLSTGFDEIIAVNTKAVLLGAHVAAPHLAASSGSIIVTVSPASFSAGGGGVLYTASKHATAGLVRQLAYELAPEIRVNGVAPGATRTNLRCPEIIDRATNATVAGDDGRAAVMAVTPLQRVAEPDDHADAYVLLASISGGCSITGEIIRTDGGMAVGVRPGLLARAVARG